MDPKETDRAQRRVLIVDRERFSTLIGRMLPVDRYLTDTATDGLQAIRKLRAEPPDIVLIEQSIDGGGLRLAELLRMNAAFRHIPLILMSVTPSPEGIIRARNAGVDAYLAKPFRPSELRDRIEGLFEPPPVQAPAPEPAEPARPSESPEEENRGDEIRARIKQIDGLPSFPSTHTEILELARSDTASSGDIAEQIKLDPSLLATAFKLVNSAGYGFRRKVDSLKLAVTLLGLEEIANLVMAAQVFQKLSDYSGGAGLDLQEFWKHSIGTAFTARAIAKKMQAETESAFLAGMLHDLGKVVLDRFFADYYRPVLEQAGETGQLIVQAEKEILGLTHTDVGGQLATEWQFSENYLNAILYHHSPEENRRYARLTCLVHLADCICRKIGYGSSADLEVPQVHEAVIERFNLGDRGMQILIESAEKELADADAFLLALSG